MHGIVWHRGDNPAVFTGLRLGVVIAGVLCLGAPGETWGQSAAQSESSQELSTKFTPRNQRYRIQPNDVIEMSFRFTPEFNQVVTVQPDGFTPLQDAGEVKMAGLTVNEATDWR